MDETAKEAFFDELEKIAKSKTAIMGMAGALAGGKIMLTNALHRYGHQIPGLRALPREVAGIGLRTAAQGKPMLGGLTRGAMAIMGDPQLASVYEAAHRAGSTFGPQGLHAAKTMLQQHAHMLPEAQSFTKFLGSIPIESKGIRKAIDYGFTPVSQVGQDIKSGLGKVVNKVLPKRAPAAAPMQRTNG